MFLSAHQLTSIGRRPRVRRQMQATITTVLRLCVLAALTVTAIPAQAEPPFEGRYQGRGEGRLSLKVFEARDGTDAHFVIAETAVPNVCTGEFIGIGRRGGPSTLVSSHKASDSDEVCTLTLRFGSDRKRVQMEEQGCGDFHGTTCAFVGALTRR